VSIIRCLKVAGSITAIGNTAIVLDRLGNIYSSDASGDKLKKLSFPALPNNIAQYLAQPDNLVDEKRFRAYSIKYLIFADLLVVSHEYFDERYDKTRLAVSVISIDDKSLQPRGEWRTIFLGDLEPHGPNEEGGGILAPLAPDKILLTIGDYGIEDPAVAQDPNSKMGKIMEINLSTQKSRNVSLGHRNPEGLVLTASGVLFSTEHGPSGGDELNRIIEGANYGWPLVTLGTDYGSYASHKIKFVGEHAGYQAPIFAWVPSVAVSGLLEVRGFDRRWDGDLLVGSLKGQSLFRIRINNLNVLYSEPIWIGQRLRDIAQLQDGTIVLWTDDSELQFISVDRRTLELNLRNPRSTSDTLVASCMYCHHFGPTNPMDFAPSLTNVVGRKIGSDNFRYSNALRNKEGRWTEKSLREFISDPDKFASGTGMPNLHLGEEQLIDVLRDIAGNTTTPSESSH
jgi:cytochrome c2